VTSAVTLLEVLVVPYRAGNLPLADRYEALLTRSRGVRMREIGRGELRPAAQLRAVAGVRTPDALQLAAALAEGCTAFVTNDRRLPSLPGCGSFRWAIMSKGGAGCREGVAGLRRAACRRSCTFRVS
jgi:predicted nucleic acid-binding protein